MTEQELLGLCRRGDREAQRELYDQTSQRVYRVLLRMARNAEDAFDLAQETYLKAFRELDRFDGRSAVATWLYRIAVNEALQFIRRSKKITIRQGGEGIDPVERTPLDRGDVRLDVNDAMAKMPPTDRAMLLLRYQEGLDYREIAEIMGCAEGTVASRLNRSRQRLRELLEESYSSREDIATLKHPKVTGK